jgi:hypothetical protein
MYTVQNLKCKTLKICDICLYGVLLSYVEDNAVKVSKIAIPRPSDV